MFLKRLLQILVLASLASATTPLHAQSILLDDSFSAFANGNLVGQNGWTQLLASSTAPLQVQNGQLVVPFIAAGTTVDNQDVFKSFLAPVPSPGAGSTSVFVGMSITVVNSGTLGSYFFAMSDTSAGFANFRVTARDNSATTPGTFQLGARVTGQAGYPFVYGTGLNYNTTYRVVIEAQLNAGATNDQVLLYIDPTISNHPVYATGTYNTGPDGDIGSLGIAIFSQFANATMTESGVLINNITVADNLAAAVPEPTTYALMAVTGLTAGAWHLARRFQWKKSSRR